MTDAPGTITGIDGDDAIVRMDEVGCGRCHEPGGCGGNNLGRMFCTTPRVFRVRNPDHAPLGAQVRVVIADGAIRRGAVFAYVVPLLALFAGAFVGASIFGEVGAILGSAVGLVVAWVGLKATNRQRNSGSSFQPYIRQS